MQSPTPPTKPTPPTPPNMKTSTGITSTDTSSPTTTAPQSIIPAKSTTSPPTVKEQSTPPAATLVPETTNNLPPLASTGTSPNTANDTTSGTTIPATTNLVKSSSSSTGLSVFFVLIFIIAITFIASHWWRNYKPKQKSLIDYSTESSEEIVSLIFSEQSPESATQATPKRTVTKILPQTEATPKTKSNFEVRV